MELGIVGLRRALHQQREPRGSPLQQFEAHVDNALEGLRRRETRSRWDERSGWVREGLLN